MKKLVSLVAAICLLACVFAVTGAAEAAESYGFGYMDRDGNVVIEPQFDYAYAFFADRGMIFSGSLSSYGYPDKGLYGYIDKTGKVVIPTIYDSANSFSEDGLAVVCKNGKYGIIDVNGDTVVDFTYDYIATLSTTNKTYKAFKGTLNQYGSPDKGTYYVIQADGTEVFSGNFSSLYGYDWYYEAYQNSKYAVFGLDGTQLTDFVYDSLTGETESVVAFKKGGYYGYMDPQGNVLIDPAYDSVTAFVDGNAIVKKNGRYFLIDETGATIVSYKADYVGMSITNGLTYAFEGSLSDYGFPNVGYYYLMSIDGTYITRGYKKGDCYSITENGIWRVKEGEQWHTLDASGNEILPPIACDYFYTCGDDRYTAKRGDTYALFDEKGNPLTDFVWNDIGNTPSELIPVQRLPVEPDFRSVRWGMTEDEVKALEGYNPSYTGRLDGRNAWYIGYDTSLMGNSVILAYYFGPDGLYEARYIWTESHSNENLYISDYASVREQLTKKYGAPWWDKESWDTTSHQNYYSDDKGNALSYGYLTYETCYTTPRSNITMQMGADNYKVSFIVYYDSRSISAPEEDYSTMF